MKKNLLTFGVACLFGLAALSSCDKSDMNAPIDKEAPAKKFKVSAEYYELMPDGTLKPLSDPSLRGVVENEKGKIDGVGEYDKNTQITVTASAKGAFRLYKFYEKAGVGGATATTGLVNQATKPSFYSTYTKDKSAGISLAVSQDLTFVAVFSSASGTIKYKDPVIGNVTPTMNPEGETKTFTVDGVAYKDVLDYSGQKVGEEVVDEHFKAWDVKSNQPWLTVSNSNGTVSVKGTSHFSKTEPARTATVTISKGDKSVTKTFTQNSWYKGSADPNSTNRWSEAKNAPAWGNGNITISPKGQTIDLTTLSIPAGLKAKTFVLTYDVYENGKVTKTENVTVTNIYYSPSASWLTQGTWNKYTAPRNTTGASRTCTVKVIAKDALGDLKTATLTFTQAADKYTVGGEIL